MPGQSAPGVSPDPATPPRRPTLETINLFFAKNTAPKAALDAYEMNYQLFETSKQLYYDEFKQRILAKDPNAREQRIVEIWDLLVRCFKEKNVELAKQFVKGLEEFGLQPVQAESQRIFWSGKASKDHAFSISQAPPQPTALEKTDVGQLLDKLSLFKVVPWELSTILWALVSRYFGMGATGDVHVYLDGGFAMGNVFWNDELPMLRLMQRYGAVKNIIMHIWHTRENRWIPEFNIQSDSLMLVFDKAKRVPAPTDVNPNATVSYRFAKPIKMAVLRRTFERFLRSPERKEPLVFYEFRKETCIFARPFPMPRGLRIEFFEYGTEVTKQLHIYSEIPYDKIPAIEKFLMANYRGFSQMPISLKYVSDAIFDDRDKILVLKDAGTWLYKATLLQRLATLNTKPAEIITYILGYFNSTALSSRYNVARADAGALRRLVEEVFDGLSGGTPLIRVMCLRNINASATRNR